MYSKKLEELISAALLDGNITEKERQTLIKIAEAEGVDRDEFEMVLDSRIYEKKQKDKNVVNLDGIKDSINDLVDEEHRKKVIDRVKEFYNAHRAISKIAIFVIIMFILYKCS